LCELCEPCKEYHLSGKIRRYPDVCTCSFKYGTKIVPAKQIKVKCDKCGGSGEITKKVAK
ncbi:hypothetical protein LCGC14_1498670, partial [marine sediment metagenome]